MPKKKITSETTEAEANRIIDKEVKELDKELRAKGDKVTMMIPLDSLNPKNKTKVIQMNGAKYVIPRGKPVEVPRPIFEIYEMSQEATIEASGEI